MCLIRYFGHELTSLSLDDLQLLCEEGNCEALYIAG